MPSRHLHFLVYWKNIIQHIFNHTTVQCVRVYQILSSCFCSLYSVVVFLVHFHINLSSCFLPYVTPAWFGSNHTCLSSVVIWAVYRYFLVSFQIVIVCSSQQRWFHQAHVGSCSVILIWVAFFLSFPLLSAFAPKWTKDMTKNKRKETIIFNSNVV